MLDSPKYTEAPNQLAIVEGAKTEKGWWELPSGKLLVPEELAATLISQTHQATHLGHDKLEELTWKYFLVPHLSSLMQDKISELHCLLTGQCCLLAQTETSRDSSKRHDALWTPGSGLHWNKTSLHYHYLLVMVCMFSEWVEAFPIRTERVSKEAWWLLREIVPRFGLPTNTGSNHSFQSHRKAMLKNAQITAQLHSSHTLVK